MPTQLILRPMQDDPELVRGDNGRAHWRARSFDPAFIASIPPQEPPLRPGWYMARANMVQRSGQIAGPRLYIPFVGGGYSEHRSVTLIPEGGAYEAEFVISSATDHLRFDPSIYPCEFDCDGIELVPITGRRRWVRSGGSFLQALGRLKARQLEIGRAHV